MLKVSALNCQMLFGNSLLVGTNDSINSGAGQKVADREKMTKKLPKGRIRKGRNRQRMALARLAAMKRRNRWEVEGKKEMRTNCVREGKKPSITLGQVTAVMGKC